MDRRAAGFPGILDPEAQEFRPQQTSSSSSSAFALLPPQIYHPYPPSSGVVGVGFQQPQPLPLPLPAHVRPSPTTAPTRAVLLTLVPAHVTEATAWAEMEAFGGVRAVQMERAGEGAVTVHFYDVRDAQRAVVEIQEQHMRQQSRLGQHYSLVMGNWGNSTVLPVLPVLPMPGERGLVGGQAVWANFSVPGMAPEIPDWQNQGTLVVFNLAADVSSSEIKEIFEAFGAVKELRETPLKKQHRFVEFYDVRDAARALSEMNGKEIHGKRLVVEFSRPGGQVKRFSMAAAAGSSPPSNNKITSNSYCRRNANYPPPPVPLPPPPLPHGSHHLPHALYYKNSPLRGGSASSTSSGASSSKAAMPSEQDHPSRRNPRKNPIKGMPTQLKPPSSATRRSSSLSKNSHQKRQAEASFLFKEDAGEETRTTVMIKNIPNKYSQKLLLNMLDNHCIHCNEQIAAGDDEQPFSAYDFVYLPIDFTNKCNVGYGFVNLTSPKAAWRLYKSFHSQAWEVFNSRKICQVTYARLQGLDALKEHFKNSKFACDTDEYLPVVFSPPRDGKQLTEPVAVGGVAIKAKKTAAGGNRKKKKSEEQQMDGGDSSTTTTTSNQIEGGNEEDEEAEDNDDENNEVGEGAARLHEVMSSSCSLSNEAQQQPKAALSCAQVS